MEIFLPPELEDFVRNQVNSGRYKSTDEVVAEALLLMKEHERIRAAQIAEFESELKRRLDSLDAGESVDLASVRSRLQRRSAELRKKSA
jgi:antitoxin ParD1/3/4